MGHGHGGGHHGGGGGHFRGGRGWGGGWGGYYPLYGYPVVYDDDPYGLLMPPMITSIGAERSGGVLTNAARRIAQFFGSPSTRPSQQQVPIGRQGHRVPRPRHPRLGPVEAAVHGEMSISHNPDGSMTIHHQPHGETASIGAEGWAEPNFDATTGIEQLAMLETPVEPTEYIPVGNDDPLLQTISVSGVDNSFEATQGGTDPFGLAKFGAEDEYQSADAQESPIGDMSLPGPGERPTRVTTYEMEIEDEAFEPHLRSGRNRAVYGPEQRLERLPVDFGEDIGFEDENYAGFGPAPLLGFELPGRLKG